MARREVCPLPREEWPRYSGFTPLCSNCEKRCDEPNDWNTAMPLWYGRLMKVVDRDCVRQGGVT